MTREKATRIVNGFFNDMNPALWNGEGNKPESFDERPWQCKIVDGINLEITFAYDEEDGWHHYCDLVYTKDNSSFDLMSGYGIDSNIGVLQYDHIYDENGNIIDDNEYSSYLVTEDELFGKYGYLMDENHGRDVDLLVDIMKCNGVRIEKLNNSYLVIDDMEV